MRIGGIYAHYPIGELTKRYDSNMIAEVGDIIALIADECCRLKKPRSAEIKRAARVGIELFYSPRHISAVCDWYLWKYGWDLKPRILTRATHRDYREIGAIKNRLGLDILFGKYYEITYSIIVKMILFRKVGLIDNGIVICAMASMLPHMPSGIGTFEQVRWDLHLRGAAAIDTPVILVGIETDLVSQESNQR